MTDTAIRKTLLALAAARAAGSTFCPSEAARRLAPGDWRPLMPQVREVAGALVAQGKLCCTQSGREVDPVKARGPIRLARRDETTNS